jgi:hypothetical protein
MIAAIKRFFRDLFDQGATSQKGSYSLLIALTTLSSLLVPYLSFYELTTIFLSQTLGIPGFVPGLVLVSIGLYFTAVAIQRKSQLANETGEIVDVYVYGRVVRLLSKIGFFFCMSILLIAIYSFGRSLVPLPYVLVGYVKCENRQGPLENANVSLVDAKRRPILADLEYTTDNDGTFLIKSNVSVWRTNLLMVVPAAGKPQYFSLANYQKPPDDNYTLGDINTYSYAYCK